MSDDENQDVSVDQDAGQEDGHFLHPEETHKGDEPEETGAVKGDE